MNGTSALFLYVFVDPWSRRGPGLPFADVLTAEQIAAACTDEGASFGAGPGNVYSVAVTLWAFLAQVLSLARPLQPLKQANRCALHAQHSALPCAILPRARRLATEQAAHLGDYH